MITLQANNYTIIRDDYREERIAFFNEEPQQFNLKRDGMENSGRGWVAAW